MNKPYYRVELNVKGDTITLERTQHFDMATRECQNLLDAGGDCVVMYEPAENISAYKVYPMEGF